MPGGIPPGTPLNGNAAAIAAYPKHAEIKLMHIKNNLTSCLPDKVIMLITLKTNQASKDLYATLYFYHWKSSLQLGLIWPANLSIIHLTTLTK